MTLASVSEPYRASKTARRIELYQDAEVERRAETWEALLPTSGVVPLSLHPAWLRIFRMGLGHTVYCLEAAEGETSRGILPLAYVNSWMFGRYLVSLPYLNYGGPIADNDDDSELLVDRAIQLADELDVKHLLLRGSKRVSHSSLSESLSTKVQMRLTLPRRAEDLWRELDGKVRNQIRKGQKSALTVAWGSTELLPAFYSVYAHNMRDLGTPVYGQRLFRAILETFLDRAEICVVYESNRAVAAALLLHGWQITEVPSASSLRASNHTGANMLMYWHLLQRTIERKQQVFDFGRSSIDSGTYRFKKQWGADACPMEWQYYLRSGDIKDMRPENPRYRRLIRAWQQLPIFVTRWIGPRIARGVP